MNPDDPFADFQDSESTVLKPTPGGGRLGGSPQRAAPAPPQQHPDELPRAGLNRLEAAAAALLALVPGLKNTPTHPDVGGLHQQLIRELQNFDGVARRLGVGDEQTLTRARYVLCATLDDIILNTPWGQRYGWAQRTLQGNFFRKEWAGDEFFKLLDRLLTDPANHRDLLELMYVCLALGFKGGYRLYNRQGELEARRERLYLALRGLRGEASPELAPHWRGVIDKRNPVMRHVPLWALAAVAAAVLLGLYLALSFRLDSQADPVFVKLQAVRGTIAARAPDQEFKPPPPPPAPVAVHDALRQALVKQPCLSTGNVVTGKGASEHVVGTYIRTNGDCGDIAFASAKWTVKPAFRQLLDTIARLLQPVLAKAPGQILINGYTDNVPGRFMSNVELSQKRAESVRQVLVQRLGSPQRFRAEGHGDSDPIASNATPQGRARNRRVEILVLYPNVLL